MQVNPEDSPQDIFVTWSSPQMTDFENIGVNIISKKKGRPENRTAARGLSWPYSNKGTFVFW